MSTVAKIKFTDYQTSIPQALDAIDAASALPQTGLIVQQREGRSIRCFADCDLMGQLVGFLADECCTGVTVTAELETVG